VINLDEFVENTLVEDSEKDNKDLVLTVRIGKKDKDRIEKLLELGRDDMNSMSKIVRTAIKESYERATLMLASV
jgi:hypothetical protein